MLQTMNAPLVTVMLLSASIALGQTNASKASTVVWKADLKQSTFGPGPQPKSLTLNIIKDTPDAIEFRVDVVDATGKSDSYSWGGPVDGTLQPLKNAAGQVIGRESLKRDGDALLRHGEDPSDGSSFDSRSTTSADGKTMTDVITIRSKDGKTSKMTTVFHRSN